MNAATEAAKEARYLQQLLREMQWPINEDVNINVDNQAVFALSHNNLQQTKTKHIAVKIEYLRELTSNRLITLTYIPTQDNCADMLTKGLGRIKTTRFCQILFGSPEAGVLR